MRKSTLLTTKSLLELLILNMLGGRSVTVEEMMAALTKTNISVSLGTLYPQLLHMRKAGLLYKGLEEMDEGGLKYCFSITETGRSRLKFLRKELHRINALINKTKSPLQSPL